MKRARRTRKNAVMTRCNSNEHDALTNGYGVRVLTEEEWRRSVGLLGCRRWPCDGGDTRVGSGGGARSDRRHSPTTARGERVKTYYNFSGRRVVEKKVQKKGKKFYFSTREGCTLRSVHVRTYVHTFIYAHANSPNHALARMDTHTRVRNASHARANILLLLLLIVRRYYNIEP